MTAKSWLCTGWQTYRKNWWVLSLGWLLWFAWDLTFVILSCFQGEIIDPVESGDAGNFCW